MSKINLTPNEFADLVAIFLFDKLLHPDEVVPNNVEFNKLSDAMRGKGMKPLLMNYYMDLDANMRTDYKRIKDTLEGTSTETAVINIKAEKAKKEKKPGLIRRTIKKLLKKEEISTEERELLLEALLDGGFLDELEAFEDEG
jgi:hypothetical protein